ncbi:MAG: hypothetical protein JWQ78_1527 [Sediminibacterium sp.]|nr:hypothetical protein [Sediminibacterium sp.]
MKKTHIKGLACAGLLLAAITFTAWKIPGFASPANNFSPGFENDTTPAKKRPSDKWGDKRDYKIGDLDQAMKDLDKAMVDLDKNMKIDFGKMEKEMKLAMEEIRKIDFEKIGHEVEASLKKVDWDKARVEVDKALREAEIRIREVDLKKMEKEIARAKDELSAEKINAHLDIEKIRKSVDEGMAKAKLGLEKAKKELTLLKEFTESLEKDGLISKKKGYKIEIRNGEMYINGTQQSKEVNDKYRKYFKEEDYTIRSDGDNISSL